MTTYYFANRILDYITRRTTSLTGSFTTYLGLSYTKPNRDGTGVTEPNEDTGYERVVLGVYDETLSKKMVTAVDGVTKNTNDEIHFNEANIEYPQNVTHYLIYMGNNLAMYGELTNAIKPVKNSVPMVRKNELVLTVDIED